MNNKIIILGTVSMDWHYAKGKYSCNCAYTEDTNAFDRVICGILYKSHGYLLKTEIASIIGFNIIDNPSENRYCDHSEKAIFDKAISSLVKYGLVTDDNNALILTEGGKNSFETHTKQRVEEKEVELWVDEFAGVSFCNDMVKGLPTHSIEYQKHPDWNLLNGAPMDVLGVQKKELINTSAGNTVTSINCLGIEYFVSNLECIICYNVETNVLQAISASGSHDTDNILLNNALLQNQILKKYFEGKRASVIYKPSYQEEIEDYIIHLESKDIKFSNVITCKEDFRTKFNVKLLDNNSTILYLSIEKITNNVKEYLRGLSCSIICVDYVEGDFDEINSDSPYIIEDNICYFHVDELRTSDFCVYDKKCYSVLPYVVDYKEISYSISLVYENEDKKYNYAVLYAPYTGFMFERAINIARSGIENLKKNPSPKIVSNVMKTCVDIYSLISVSESSNISLKVKELEKSSQQMLVVWNNSLHDRLNTLEADIIAGQNEVISRDTLRQIQSDINASIRDEDVLKHLSEVEQRIEGVTKIKGPKIELQTIYILDTSIFMDMPRILDKFNLAHDKVVVPRSMEQELDGLKKDPDKKLNASMALLLLRRKQSDYPQFLSIKDNVDKGLLPIGFDPDKKDNDMLATAIELEKSDKVDKVTIVANDAEFIHNINDCINSGTISERIEGINLDELLIRLSD